MTIELLLVAKAPVPGQVKTRLGAGVGMAHAAKLAAAALRDTIEVCEQAYPGHCHLALKGCLDEAVDGPEIAEMVSRWRVFAQQGRTFSDRLQHAHLTASSAPGAMTVQIGMDTPQVTSAHLAAAGDALKAGSEVVLGPATDGGWWLLGLAQPQSATALSQVQMSRTDTAKRTVAALAARGHPDPFMLAELIDVDALADARLVAPMIPQRLFAQRWNELGVTA